LPDGLGVRFINTAHCSRRPAYTYCRQVAFNARPSIYLARSAAAGSIEISVSVCLSASISPKLHIRRLSIFVHVTTYGRGSIAICRLSDKLCTSGFLNDVILFHNGPNSHVNTVAATPLQRCTQANAPAAWCWLYPVLDDARRPGLTSLSRKECRGGVCEATLRQLREWMSETLPPK